MIGSHDSAILRARPCAIPAASVTLRPCAARHIRARGEEAAFVQWFEVNPDRRFAHCFRLVRKLRVA